MTKIKKLFFTFICLIQISLFCSFSRAQEPINTTHLYDFTAKVTISQRMSPMCALDYPQDPIKCSLYIPVELDIINNNHGNLDEISEDLTIICRTNDAASEEIVLNNVKREGYGTISSITTGWWIFSQTHNIPHVDFSLRFSDTIKILNMVPAISQELKLDIEENDDTFDPITIYSGDGVDRKNRMLKLFPTGSLSTESFTREAAYLTRQEHGNDVEIFFQRVEEF